MSTITNALAVEWCEKARKLLKKKTLSVGKGAYEVDLKEVSKNAQQYIDELKQAELKTAAAALEKELQELGKLISGFKKESETERTQKIKAPATQLDKSTATAKVVLTSHAGYTIARESALKHRRNLKAQGADYARHSEFKDICDRLDQTAPSLLSGLDLPSLNRTLPTYCQQLAKKQIDPLAKTCEQNLKDERTKQLNAAEYQSVYEDKVKRINAAIEELQLLPDTSQAISKLKGLLTAGDKVAKTGDYKKAYDALEGLSGAVKDGKNASEKFSKSVGGKQLQTDIKVVEVEIKKFNDLAGISHADKVSKARNDLQNVLVELSKKPVDDNAIKAAQGLLTKIKEYIAQESKTIALQSDQCTQAVSKLQADVELLEKIAEYSVANEVSSGFREAKSLMGLQDYTQALAAFKKVEEKIGQKKGDATKLHNEWQKTFKTVTDQLDQDAKAVEPFAQLFPDLNRLRGELAVKWQIEILNPLNDAKSRNYKKATDDANKLIGTDRQPFVDALKDFVVIQSKVEEHTSLRKSEADRVRKQLDLVAKEQADIDGFEQRLQVAMANFTSAVKNLLDPKVANKTTAYESARDAYKLACATIEKEAQELLDPKNKKDLDTLVTAKADKEQRKTLEAQIQNYSEAIKFLTEEQYPTAKVADLDKELKRLANALATIPTDLKKIATDLGTLKDLIVKAVEDSKTQVSQLAQQAKADVKNCQQALKTLRSGRKPHEPFLKTLETQIDALELALSSTSKVAVERTKELLVQLKDRMEKTLPGEFTAVDQAIADIKKKLDQADIKKFFPQRKKTLELRLQKSVLVATYQQAPADAMKPKSQLMALKEEVEALAKRAAENVNIFTEVETLAESTENRLKDDLFKAIFKTAPKVLAQIKGRIEAAKTPDEFPRVALNNLKAINLQLDSYASEAHGAGKGAKAGDNLLEKEAQAVKNETEAELKEKKFMADLAVFSKNDYRQAESKKDQVSPRFDELRWKQLEKLYKQAEKFGNKKQLDRAQDTLSRAKLAAREFIENPLGPTHAARGNLTAIEARWKSVVGNFAKAANTLANTLESAAKGDTSVNANEFKLAIKTIRDIAILFDPAAFSAIVKDMIKPDIDVKDLRRRKEEGLRQVRAYQQRVAKNSLIADLSNPAVNAVHVVNVGRIIDVLNDWELNLKRA